jgi:hypothetical protein
VVAGSHETSATGSVSAPLALLNLGAAPLHVTDLRLEGAGYRIEGCAAPVRIEPLSECIIRVSYRPASSPADGRGSITLTTDDPEHPVHLVGLDSPPAVPALAVSPGRIDFGAVPSGAREEKRVQVVNLGRATADGIKLSWTASGDFTASAPATELPPGDTAEVTVTYSPTGGNADSATLELSWSGGMRRVSLSGYQDLKAPD